MDFKIEPWPELTFNETCRNKILESIKKYYYNENKQEAIKIGVDLLKQGYDITEYYNNVYTQYNSDCMKATVTELLKENTVYKEKIIKCQNDINTLNDKLLEEQLRPPELGGSEYKKCQQHFNSLQ